MSPAQPVSTPEETWIATPNGGSRRLTKPSKPFWQIQQERKARLKLATEGQMASSGSTTPSQGQVADEESVAPGGEASVAPCETHAVVSGEQAATTLEKRSLDFGDQGPSQDGTSLSIHMDAESRALRKLCASLSSSQEELEGKIAELEQRLPLSERRTQIDLPSSSAIDDDPALETKTMEENVSLKLQLAQLEERLKIVESQKKVVPVSGGCCVLS